MNDKQRKRLTIASFLGVISLGITSLSFSYAWYAGSSRVEVSGVDMYVRADRDLRISMSSVGEYKYELTNQDFKFDQLFDPCSSMDRNIWMDQEKEQPEFYRYDMPFIDKDGTPRHTVAHTGVFTQELYLKVDDDAYITLDKEMLKVSENVEKNLIRVQNIKSQYPEYTEAELLERLNSLKKCLRVSILIPDEDYRFYVIDPYKEGDTYLGGRIDLEKTGYYAYHVKDEELYETVYGEIINRDKIVYGAKNTTDTPLVGEETSFNARSRANVYPFDLEKSIENGMEIKKEDSITVDELEDEIIIPMYHEVPKRVVVSIYMEGWDLDCTNAHMGASFDLGLGFKILREM